MRVSLITARNDSEPLVGGIGVLPEADQIVMGVRTTRRDDGHVSRRDEIAFNEQSPGIRTSYREAVVVGRRLRAMDDLAREVGGRCLAAAAVIHACAPSGHGRSSISSGLARMMKRDPGRTP